MNLFIMWKYIVTCFIVIVTRERKEFNSEDLTWQNGKPVVSYYYEIKSDTLIVKDTFSKRKDAVNHIEIKENSKFFNDAYNTNGRKAWFKLDSIKAR